MTAYYNEIDPFAAAWLRELIKAGHIAPGDVDERSIEDVVPYDLRSYKQCHFFAGIGVWSYALRKAGWPDDREVWTGSCPCQPFSSAGKRTGVTDERHLWPAWFHLIEANRPSIVFGEQVEAAIRQGWLDLVQADLEGSDYTFGACGLPACGFGAPHIRQRLYFVANSNSERCRETRTPEPKVWACGGGSTIIPSADTKRDGLQGRVSGRENTERKMECGSVGCSGATNGPWKDADWFYYRDGKYRPVEPGTFPLAHGSPNRVGRLRGYGNALVAPVAQGFIEAFLETERENQ